MTASPRSAKFSSRNLQDAVAANENLILGSMLLLLHLSMWWGFGSSISASLLLAHFGLFLIWQPIWQRDQRLAPSALIVFAVLTGAFLYWQSWWLLFGWLVLLIGIVAGRTLSSRAARAAYFLSLVFLVTELLIKCVSSAFDIANPGRNLQDLFRYSLIGVPVVIALIPLHSERPGVDIFRATAASLLIALLALGSLLIMYHRGVDYPTALLMSLFALASFLVLISWLLTPQGSIGGFAQFWERALLNIGTPFEDWLAALAELADEQQTPEQFITAASEELLQLPWVQAVSWHNEAGEQTLGERSAHEISLSVEELEISAWAERPVGPMLLLHCKLLLQLLAHFYVSKLRERELAQQAHLQAIYETGARVTHDIKNLLQGLQSITAALSTTDGAHESRQARARALFAEQLPHITRRLEAALDKLQAPGDVDSPRQSAKLWWQRVSSRGDSDLGFTAQLDSDLAIPAELFDSVLENLVDNARAKNNGSDSIYVQINLSLNAESIILSVTDNGAAIPAERVQALGKQAVSSSYGLGIGLYQASKQAQLYGYTLALVNNEPGKVSFSLSKDRIETVLIAS